MAQSDARFGYKADLSREDHDLSQWYGFTCAPGMLLPIWFDLATPGDAYYMQHNLPLLRSTVLAAPAMVDVKVHYETFFIPMQMIYEPFENTLFGLRNTRSSTFVDSQLLNSNFPLFDYSSFSSVLSQESQTGVTRADSFRLADLLGLNGMNFVTSVSSPSTDPRAINNLFKYAPSFFPWQICAYHTIFNYYYRLDDKSPFDFKGFSNLDVFYNQDTFQPANAFMRIHQRPWDFDYFTSIYRSPIISSVNTQALSTIYPDLSAMQVIPINRVGQFNGSLSNDEFTSYAANNTTQSVASDRLQSSSVVLRQLFANEKLSMITGRTKKNYDSQVLAHYGVDVPHDVKHDITMIRHDSFDLNVQEVTSLADTSFSGNNGVPLGELAGKSYASGKGQDFKFVAPCHGVIMTIFSVEPKKRYFGGFDRINSVTTAYDLPVPEFDRLGNMPMYRYETGMVPNVDNYFMTDLIGWKERYYQYKRKFDKTSLAFGNGVTSNFGYNNYSPYMLAFRPFALYNSGQSSNSQTLAPRPDLEERFYIERNACDAMSIISFYNGWLEGAPGEAENWSVSPWLVYARDPFIVNSRIDCKKVSWMSKDGEPIYPF